MSDRALCISSRKGTDGSRPRAFRAALALALLLTAVHVVGCGLQTEEANRALRQAMKHQQAAEAILARVQNFSAEWQALFNAPRSQQQVDGARQLIKARADDIDALSAELEAWEKDLRPIRSLNVEAEVKEYVRLKLDSIDCFQEYVTSFLMPIFDAYNGLVEAIARNSPQAELNEIANGITELVTESTTKLEECRGAQKQADDYFQEKEIGR